MWSAVPIEVIAMENDEFRLNLHIHTLILELSCIKQKKYTEVATTELILALLY